MPKKSNTGDTAGSLGFGATAIRGVDVQIG